MLDRLLDVCDEYIEPMTNYREEMDEAVRHNEARRLEIERINLVFAEDEMGRVAAIEALDEPQDLPALRIIC